MRQKKFRPGLDKAEKICMIEIKNHSYFLSGGFPMNAAVAQLINEQINKEFYSAYLYLDFANYYAAAGLDGFENWYRVQAQEERDHALLFFQYLLNFTT
jgi:hypothetical protein